MASRQTEILHTSTDEGATWDEVGTVPGQPAAIAAQGEHVVVLAGDTIFESTDGGANFAPRITGVIGSLTVPASATADRMHGGASP